MQHHLAAGRVMMQDQRLGVVGQNLPWHAAESSQGALQSVEPTVLPLMSIRAHMQPARVAECRHEEGHLDRNTADLDTAFAEIDLQLLARVVSKRSVAGAAATSSQRKGAVARSTVRRLTTTPFSIANSWRTTSA